MLKKVNEKKVLHKVKKQWVILGTALFALGTAGAYSESVHADTTGDNHSSVVTPSAATTDTKSADSTNSVATTSSGASATSSGVTSSSSTVTSGSASASQTATTTLQTDNSGQSTADATGYDDISFRDGDADNTSTIGNSSVASASDGVRPTLTTATNVSLVDSEPSNNGSLSTIFINSYSNNSVSIGMSVSGSDNTIYHTGISGIFIYQFVNDSNATQILGIDNLVQHMQLSGRNEVSSSADISKYAQINSNVSSGSSSVYQVTLSSGPINDDKGISNYYYNGDKVWWTFNTIPNPNFSSSVNTNAAISDPYPTTPMQIQYVDSSGNTIKGSQWITGDNIYPGTTYDGINIPKIDGYSYNGTTYNGASAINLKKVDNNYVLYGTFSKYNSPDKQGNINPIVLTLTYNRLPSENVTVNYYDVDNGSSNAIVSGASLSGYAGDTLSYSTQDIVNSLTNQGYELTSTSPSASNSITISSDANSNTYNYNFTHKKVTYDGSLSSYPSGLSQADLTKTFTRTIDFVYSNGSGSYNTISSASQNVTYSRSATYDEVTKSVVSYGDWSSPASAFDEYTAPTLSGYINPNPTSVAAQSVGINDASSTSTSIVYQVQQFSGNVKYFDQDDNNTAISGTGLTFSGTNNATISYSTQSVVDSLTAKGYKLTSGNPSTSTSLTVNNSNNDYTFTFVHNKVTYDANNSSYPNNLTKSDFAQSFTRTINFVDSATDKPISSAATQTVTYSRSRVYDEVTKSFSSYSSWSASSSAFPEFTAPSIDGYTNPQPTSVVAQPVAAPTSDGSESTAFSASIAYTKSSAQSYYTPTYTSSAGSDAPIIFYSASSSVSSSAASSSSVTSSSASATSFASSSASSVAAGTIKMYNYKTELVKSNDQILIFIEPKYAPNAENGLLSNQFVVNQTLDNGQVSHSQQVTLDQYNSMLTASGKQPYTPETLNQAYVERNDYNGVLKNNEYKTTFNASIITNGNNVVINTDTPTNGFNKPADNQLVPVSETNRANKNNDKKKTSKSKHQSEAKKKSQKKAKRAHKHVKKSEHHVTKHTHHVKHDRKAKK